jgi:hypothetical protein
LSDSHNEQLSQDIESNEAKASSETTATESAINGISHIEVEDEEMAVVENDHQENSEQIVSAEVEEPKKANETEFFADAQSENKSPVEFKILIS